MAPPFVFPSSLRELEEEPNDHRLYVGTLTDISVLRHSELEELVKGLAFDLSDKELFCVEDQDVFDRVYSLVKGFSRLTPSCKFNFVETLRSNLSILLPNVDSLSRSNLSSSPNRVSFADRVASHRNAFKIYTFFLFNIVLAEDSSQESSDTSKAGTQSRKKNALCAWNWDQQRGRIVSLIANSLEINLTLLFGSHDLDENYLSFLSKCTFTLFENPVLLKDADTRDSLCRMIGTIATKHKRTSQSCASILHLVYKFDFTVSHLADAVALAEKKFGDGSLAVTLLREIGRTDPKDYVRDTAGAENIGRFLVELADRSPKLMATNIGILVPHFGGESYKIRNALAGVMGKLILMAFKDIDGDLSSKTLRLRSKQAMLDILIERCRDVSAYTRSRVLQVWAELCEEHAISIGLWNELASVASGRLEDKSGLVRKSALNLLITMLQHNPFGPQLRVAAFEATLEKYRKKLHEMELSGQSENAPDVIQGEAECQSQESVSDSCLPYADQGMEKNIDTLDVGNLEQTRALVASLESGLRFSRCLTSTMATLVQLMASSSTSDVENTILLLMRCRQFQIDGSEACLLKMFPLIFSQDKSIYEAVENAFVTIYIKKSPAETAGNLLNLVINSNIGDLAALEFMISSLVSKGEISSGTISALWDCFSFNISGVTAAQSRGALSVLCMAAKSSPAILSSHLQDVIDIGFGRWAKEDPLLARTACISLERLSEEDKEKLRSNSGTRVFGLLLSLITSSGLPDNIWYAAADKAISSTFSIHPTPEVFAADVVKKSLSLVFSSSGRVEEHIGSDTGSSNFLSSVPVSRLSRYLFIVGHVALNQLVYIESCVRKIQKQKSRRKSQFESQAVKAGFPTPAGSAAKEDGINAELGLAASDDMIIDGLSERAEKEIVSGSSTEKNLIGFCAPFLLKLCRNYNLLQKFPELQASAMLALCRLMIIDAEFCEANLQLLFTVVEGAPSETVRSNCTVALGDLAVRFPNLLEPWTENMYARLRDPSVSVRKNAVLVLSHLILNDMMKVKGYINEMAVRLEDEDERISSLAKLFFHELSKKGANPIYNLLADILGRLSNQNLKKEAFCNIMQFLITSIKKDKQMEALVEKLCNRFSGVTDVQHWENIAYCLSQLTYTEKGMKKLAESLKTYEHVIGEESLMSHFKSIISKGKKFAKADFKSFLEEFEEKLTKIHEERKEQEMTARNALGHQQKVASLGGLKTSEEVLTDEDEEQDTTEDGASEVIEPYKDLRTKNDLGNLSEITAVKSERSYSASSAVTESDADSMEVQSPINSQMGFPRSKSKKKQRSSNERSI